MQTQTKEDLVRVISDWWDTVYIHHPLSVRTGSSQVKGEIDKLATLILGGPEVVALEEPTAAGKPTERLNIGETVKRLIAEIKQNKFNGVVCDIHEECKDEWREDYAIFILRDYWDAKNEFSRFDHESEYAAFDDAEFRYDFHKLFVDAFRLDPTVVVKHYDRINEFEFYRKDAE